MFSGPDQIGQSISNDVQPAGEIGSLARITKTMIEWAGRLLMHIPKMVRAGTGIIGKNRGMAR